MLPVIGESRAEPYKRLREHGYRRVAIHREPALEFAEQSSAMLSGQGLAPSAFAEIDAGPGKARRRPRSPLCALRRSIYFKVRARLYSEPGIARATVVRGLTKDGGVGFGNGESSASRTAGRER